MGFGYVPLGWVRLRWLSLGQVGLGWVVFSFFGFGWIVCEKQFMKVDCLAKHGVELPASSRMLSRRSSSRLLSIFQRCHMVS